MWIAGLALATMGVLLHISPASRQIVYALNYLMPNLIPDADSLCEAYIRGLIDTSTFHSGMRSLGYDVDASQMLVNIKRILLSANDNLALLWRGEISREEYIDRMVKLGFRLEDAELFAKANRPLPSLSDILLFMVREVFNEDVVKKYGYDEGYDQIKEKVMEWASKHGLTEDIVKMYWRAHWRLPSLTEAIDLYRRLIPMDEGAEEPTDITINGKTYGRVIGKETLKDLLKIADIPVYWREKLLQLAYEIPTRVDVRRMYRLGVIGRDYVKKLYLEIGYRPEDAEVLTEYVIRDAMGEERDLNKTEILALYEDGIIGRDEAKKMLMSLNYDETEAEYLISKREYEMHRKEVKDLVELYVQLYKNGKITYDVLFDELNKLGLPSPTLDKYLLKAVTERQRNIALPSKADLERWLLNGYIDVNTYVEKMRALGYGDDDIAIYLTELMDKIERGEERVHLKETGGSP